MEVVDMYIPMTINLSVSIAIFRNTYPYRSMINFLASRSELESVADLNSLSPTNISCNTSAIIDFPTPLSPAKSVRNG